MVQSKAPPNRAACGASPACRKRATFGAALGSPGHEMRHPHNSASAAANTCATGSVDIGLPTGPGAETALA